LHAGNVSAGAALATTDDAVGKAAAAATVTPATTTANVEEDLLFDTFRSLCRNRSDENKIEKCGSVLSAACAALRNKTKVLKNEAKFAGTIYVPNVAQDVLLGLDPASRARARACSLTQISKRKCRQVLLSKKASFDRKRDRFVSEAPKLLVQLCGFTSYYVDKKQCDSFDEKCLRAFKKGKTSIQFTTASKETTGVQVLLDSTTYTETARRWTTHTFDCCTKADRCLCEMKKRLGNNTNIRIPCLEKKELQACN
jgi:hypothetical protein